MPKFYIRWQFDWTTIDSAYREEMSKRWLSWLEMIKREMQTGRVKDWGIYSGGSGGYCIREEADEENLHTSLLEWMPYVQFNVNTVLTVDQAIESIKKTESA